MKDRRRCRVLAGLWALLAACGPPPAPAPTGGAILRLGAGPQDGGPGFVPVADGAELELQPGPQGGFHVFLSARVPTSIMNPAGLLYLDREARRADDRALVAALRERARFVVVPDDPSWSETAEPIRLVLCPTPVGVPARDTELVVRVSAFDEPAEVTPRAEGRLQLTPRCPADEVAPCARLCSG